MRSMTPWRGRKATVLAALAAVAVAGPGSAQQPTGSGQESEQAVLETVRGPWDPDEIESFLSGLMSAHLEDKTVVGATVSVVRDGEILYTGGFGHADFDAERRVDPARTLFRIGSITKLFTWVAVMQQVEAGLLSLDDDVNDHIDFAIPEAFGEPIRIWHLMTHTPGFEDRGMYLFGSTDLGRRDYLAANVPARVRPPGTYASYSNYGTTLAGHLVERVSGQSWEEYIVEHIMEPLGMEFATGHQPLPDALAPHMSTGYSNSGVWVEPEDFEVIEGQAPAGSVSASAESMARFMIALLQGGELDGQRILQPETVDLMLTRRHGHDPRVNGFGLGFYEKDSHGVRMAGHGGDTQWFHSDLTIMPDENVGVFVSYNTASGGELSFGTFLDHFMDHYYPVDEAASSIELSAAELEEYTGPYRMNRSSFTTFEKVLGLVGWPSLTATEDGALLVMGGRYLPVGNDEFVEEGGQNRLIFDRDEDGNISHGYIRNVPMMVMDRLPGLAAPSLHRLLLGLGVLAFALSLLSVPYRWYVRRRYGPTEPDDAAARKRARRWGVAVSAFNVAGLVGLGFVTSNLEGLLQAGETGGLRFTLTLFTLAALLTLGVVWQAIQTWRQGVFTLWGRLRYSGFAVLAVVFVLVLNHWNMLGWKLG